MKKTEILEALVSNPHAVFCQSYRAGYSTPKQFTIEGFTELKKDRWASKTTTYVTVRECSTYFSNYDWNNECDFPEGTPTADRTKCTVASYTKNIPLSHVGYVTHANTDEFFSSEVTRYEELEQASIDNKVRDQRRKEQAQVLQRLFIATGITENADDTMVAFRYSNDARVALTCDEADRLIAILSDIAQTEKVA